MEIDIEDIVGFEQSVQDQKPEAKPQEPSISPDDLKTYYKYFFPYNNFYDWLGNGDTEYFERREFSFTSDKYIRFQCFKNAKDFQATLERLLPRKIDFGAVYNKKPDQHNKGNPDDFYPVEKELVFDIDLTDYDEIRTCCKEARVCNRCWNYMKIAYEILFKILTEDFGFEKIMWVFSGRRGIHCWISDERARKLNNEGRTSIVKFISFNFVNVKMGVIPGLKEPIHPSIQRSISIIEKEFRSFILEDQNILNSENGKELLKGIIQAKLNSKKNIDELLSEISIILDSNSSSTIKYDNIIEKINAFELINKGKNQKLRKFATEMIEKEFMMNVLYPRLDANVSKHINHLLKSPFCIHPSTGMVCVPLREEEIMKFEMDDIPKIEEICENHKNGKPNTKLEKYKRIFDEYVTKFKEEKGRA